MMGVEIYDVPRSIAKKCLIFMNVIRKEIRKTLEIIYFYIYRSHLREQYLSGSRCFRRDREIS